MSDESMVLSPLKGSNGQTGFEPERVKAIFFDMDGTLADTDDAYIAKVAGLVKPIGFVFPQRNPIRFLRWALMQSESPINWLMTVPDQLNLDRLLGTMSDWMYRMRGQGAPAQFLLIEGVKPMLDTLAAHYPLALVTSRDRRGAEGFLAEFELRDYFKLVVSSLTADRIKPHPAPILYAAEKLNIPVADCVMVGDTYVDMIAGRKAGAQTVGVLCGFGERLELERSGAHEIVERTPMVKELLGK
jgi:N-acetyl-D-muramate 6-phosphate phosphatase